MSKWLFIGDVHCTEREIEECSSLINYVKCIVKEHKPKYIVFTGDCFHNHGIVNLNVLYFWEQAFKKLAYYSSILYILGNHDFEHNGSDEINALRQYRDICLIREYKVIDKLLFVGFKAKNEDFIKICNENPLPTVVHHQEFNTATYENGIYIRNGIDPDSIPQELIIGGHIHKEQKIGKIFYIGAPRWRSVSDVSTPERHVWLLESTPEGRISFTKSFPTNYVVSPIFEVWDSAEAKYEPPLEGWHLYKFQPRVIVNIKGDSHYIETRANLFKKAGFRVRPVKTDKPSIKVKESDGITRSFVKYTDSYSPKYGTSKDVLLSLSKDRKLI